MAAFAVTFAREASDTYAVGSTLYSATDPKATRTLYLSAGFYGTPADAAATLRIRRAVTLGTGTSVTVEGLSNDTEGTQRAAENHTVNPSMSDTIFYEAFHQRATLKWYAPPGLGLVTPADGGLAVLTPVAPTVDVRVYLIHEEL